MQAETNKRTLARLDEPSTQGVKLLGFDKRGKLRLSMRLIDQKTG